MHEHIKWAVNNLSDRYSKLEVGSDISDFNMTDLSGGELQFSDFNGQYVLLDFWFIGCVPCQRGVPYKKKPNENFGNCLDIISVNPINDVEAIAKYKGKDNLPWTFTMMDRNDNTLADLNVNSYPTYFLLDPVGKILLVPAYTGKAEDQFKLIEDELMKRCQ